MTTEARELLRFDDVRLRYGERDVLRGVSFGVRAGEVVGVLGGNGAGKTSLLRIASGLLHATGGGVRVDGAPLAGYSRRALARKLALVAQDLHVPFPFRAGEIVLMGRAPHQPVLGFESAEDVAKARAALARLDLDGLANRRITELSGGEQQLVMLARALAQDAELLLLDEPTAFLDLRHRIDVLQVVRGLAREGRGALVVSHDLTLAARICDRLVLLAEGRVLADGTPADVLASENLRAAFGIEADVVVAPDGGPVAVPRIEAHAEGSAGER